MDIVYRYSEGQRASGNDERPMTNEHDD